MWLTFARDDREKGVELSFPMTDADIDVHLDIMNMMNRHGEGFELKKVDSDIPGLFRYICCTDVKSRMDLEAVSTLACKIDGWSNSEKELFAGVLAAESPRDLNEVLVVADDLDSYNLIPRVTNDQELGQYLLKTGYLNVARHLLPHINCASVGREYRANFGGAYASSGYVRRKDTQPALDHDRDAVFTVHLRLYDGSKSLNLRLPASDAWLQHARETLKIADFCQAQLDSLECSIPYLSNMIHMDCVSVEDANELALAVERMGETDGELLKYCSILSVAKPDTFHSALQFAQDIDDYDRVPNDPAEYAKEQLGMAGAGAEILGMIEKYTDFVSMGKELMAEDGVILTEFGAIRGLDAPSDCQAQSGMQMM